MSANIIDGKVLASKLLEITRSEAIDFCNHYGVPPCVALINIGDDPASKIYIKNKIKLAEDSCVKSILHELPGDVSSQQVEDLITRLNNDKDVHGILLQLPIPKHLNENKLVNLIAPEKDVDGLTLINNGKLSVGMDSLNPCTPLGVMHMLETSIGDVSGLHAVVIGRSNIVGKPMAKMLLNAHCSVSVLHSRSKTAKTICKAADIVIAAVGKPRMITSEWIKPGATVIDVGINRIEVDGKKKIVGDVDFDDVVNIASYISKVPGGVGPLTVSFLMRNTLKAAKIQKG